MDKKNDNLLLSRVKYVSVYEMFSYVVIWVSFTLGGLSGIKIGVLVLLGLFSLLCGLVAHMKDDYISRGIALGLFANHYSLAIINTTEKSTARVNESKWPDSGLAVMMMATKLIYVFIVYIIITRYKLL